MKTFFYLQHSLVAMHDPRMKYLMEKEKLKGLGAYWFIMEKTALLPESCFELEYLRPFCKCAKISFAYIKKIILKYQLFSMDEDDFFMPEELNPPREKVQKVVQKTTKNTQENVISEAKNVISETKNVIFDAKKVIFDAKNVENQQKTSNIQANSRKNNSHKSLINGDLAENNLNIKENIKDIIDITTTATEEKEGTAAAAAVFVSAKIPDSLSPESSTAPLPESPAPLSPESPAVDGEKPPMTARITLILRHNPGRWQGTAAQTASFPEKPPQCRAALRPISPQYPAASPFGTRINTLKWQDESPPKRDAGCPFPVIRNDTAQCPKPRSSTSEMTQLDGREVRHWRR